MLSAKWRSFYLGLNGLTTDVGKHDVWSKGTTESTSITVAEKSPVGCPNIYADLHIRHLCKGSPSARKTTAVFDPTGGRDLCAWHCMPGVGEWELQSRFTPFRYFPNFSALLKHSLPIWQVSPQLSCEDTSQIWMGLNESNNYCCKIENFA